EFDVSNLTRVKKGSVNDATMGKAYVYSTLNGDKYEQYEVSIVKVDATNKDNRNYVLKINDKNLLEKAGGIVQGMSGSPIVQNGRIIGAVTHVFINDPTRGYGISIDNMTSSY
ncbi:MAG: SpoIVB peptidase S55, partial [Clostridia bacterium]|nr:SpoIVB peptidase S55 [Clostridia bacterium]